MANNVGKKISGYAACTTPESNALLVIVGNTAGIKNTFNITVNKLVGGHAACTMPESNALLVMVGNTAGTKNTFKITLQTLFGNNQENVYVANTKTLSVNTFMIRNMATPANSTATVTMGTIWWDASYLYIAIANNSIKRANLETF